MSLNQVQVTNAPRQGMEDGVTLLLQLLLLLGFEVLFVLCHLRFRSSITGRGKEQGLSILSRGENLQSPQMILELWRRNHIFAYLPSRIRRRKPTPGDGAQARWSDTTLRSQESEKSIQFELIKSCYFAQSDHLRCLTRLTRLQRKQQY